jgi:hypothetical protein
MRDEDRGRCERERQAKRGAPFACERHDDGEETERDPDVGSSGTYVREKSSAVESARGLAHRRRRRLALLALALGRLRLGVGGGTFVRIVVRAFSESATRK